MKKCGVKLLYAKDNDLRRDARVDRDQRLNAMNCSPDGCLSCSLGFCPRHRKIDDYKRLSETFDRCSPHSELYKQQVAIPYENHSHSYAFFLLQLVHFIGFALSETWRLKSSYRKGDHRGNPPEEMYSISRAYFMLPPEATKRAGFQQFIFMPYALQFFIPDLLRWPFFMLFSLLSGLA
ncbi:hypothetical protein Pint_26739 [Pistacia integerrima]|uniref:Uncharacterized protein n=1 Tax=Pistacia integerrima TaxID=434235 RepID=A0ACC0YSH2_9ROSI|nr:hypothetical protein Pint_26739 [Pistacia integerrima]